ncbi:penicillin-binding protein 1A [Fervidibacillus halotolerans]|uniref:PBP1A family penicillin-binding protein n=1 Tax=Fervidibacillus halotolerans TaxID=2980027 RepID=A0A9E8M2C5_9BACI|nr:penicillin-binding protein 1A [Fervidibacillus halotolerans]WAA13730.1 PBP1A family penicillin-binding protein [Fervidibacillus halotolerans]
MSENYRSRTEKRKASRKRKQPKKSVKQMMKRIFLTLLVLGFVMLVAGITTFAVMIQDAPEFDPEKLKDPVSSKIYDKDNQLITELGTEKRDLVTFDEIPKSLKNAILATEDARFFEHSGIDLIRLGGAVIRNITDGFGSQGASTLTQQVVKLSFLSNEKTIKRKAQEAWLSFKMEQEFTKEQIFEMYVNKVPMGGNIYGIKAAAKTYFDKELDELTLPEISLIAGLPQRPNAYNPFVNPDLANERKNTVLYLMNRHGFISNEEMEEAQNTDIETFLVQHEDQNNDDSPYESFIDQIVDEVEQMGYNVYTDGLEIYTTLDVNAQKKVHELLNSDQYFPNDEIQAGIILLDTKTGEIRAIGGGRFQKVKRGYNYAIDIQRQPGSTIKPILDYGPAIEYLKWSTYHILVDEPYSYSNGTPVNNWDGKYDGAQTMRYHLMKSRNVPAIKALKEVGLNKAQTFAENLGIPFEGSINEAYGLGGFQTGIAPIHLAGAYSAFGNNGIYNKPHAIRKILLSDGITEIDMKPESNSVMSDYTAFMITDMLKSVLQSGTGISARVPRIPIAGKTGTTNFKDKEGSPDSWFAGYSTEYTASIWVGYGDDRKRAVDDTRIPLYLFKELMTYVHQGVEVQDFKQPSSVVKLAIQKGTNPPKLASEFTPEDEIVYEYFVKGYEPTEVSDDYEVPPVSNLKAEYDETTEQVTLKWEYNDIQDIRFDVYAALDQSEQEFIGTIDKKELKITDVAPGLKYTFTVQAVYKDQKSEPVSIELDLSTFLTEPDPNEPPEQNEEEPGDQEENGEEENGDHGTSDHGNTNEPPGETNEEGNG